MIACLNSEETVIGLLIGNTDMMKQLLINKRPSKTLCLDDLLLNELISPLSCVNNAKHIIAENMLRNPELTNFVSLCRPDIEMMIRY